MASTSSDDILTLRARCHCGLACYSVSISTSALPLKSSICSCTSCRSATGQLFATFAVIPGLPVPDISKLESYASSSGLTRVFCPRCGCSILNHEAAEWEFVGGALEGPIVGLLDRQALFANDSADGGGYIWLPRMNGAGTEIQRHGGYRGSEVVDISAMRREFEACGDIRVASYGVDALEKLDVSCHCGAFQCYITRPSPENQGPPPVCGKWWLASDGKRYKAMLDACNDCRKVTGFEVNSWAYIPATNLFTYDGLPLDPAHHVASKHYVSSPGIHRDFCGTCGATVFFRKDSRSPQVWDIAVGLLKSVGARAEDWLEWDGIEYEGSALDHSFVSAIAQAMDAAISP